MTWSRLRSSPLRSPFQWDPVYEIEELRRALERIGERTAGPESAPAADSDFVPQVGLYDAGAAFVVRVDLPGVRAGDVDITVQGSTLTICGHRDAGYPSDMSCLFSEQSAGRFARTIELSEGVDVDHIKATLERGVLEIVLPKNKANGVKKVAVTVCKGE
ncbi:MAG TPA: Hsp20/alpha crystallin family protein [bacterium]|nr:Hsp20/alpha crystallin family protein [bacterium]